MGRGSGGAEGQEGLGEQVLSGGGGRGCGGWRRGQRCRKVLRDLYCQGDDGVAGQLVRLRRYRGRGGGAEGV